MTQAGDLRSDSVGARECKLGRKTETTQTLEELAVSWSIASAELVLSQKINWFCVRFLLYSFTRTHHDAAATFGQSISLIKLTSTPVCIHKFLVDNDSVLQWSPTPDAEFSGAASTSFHWRNHSVFCDSFLFALI